MCVCVLDPDDPFIMPVSSDSHAQAVKLKQQLLQDHLELCVMELKKLCIREAVRSLCNTTEHYTHTHTHNLSYFLTRRHS